MVVLLFFLVAFALLLSRLFVLQVVHHRNYVTLAAKQHRLTQDILPERGTIYAQDKNGNLIPLVLNQSQKTLVASPKAIENPEEAADVLATKLALPKEDLIQKLSKKDDTYEILAKRLDAKVAQELEKSLPAGFAFEEEKIRTYPHGTVAGRLLGFVSKEVAEEEGRYGIEKYYDTDLTGGKNFLTDVKDTAGFWIALGRKIVNPPRNGSRLILNLDYNIQLKTEEILENLLTKWRPTSGLVVVVDPRTGKLLAEAAYPVFDPNNYAKEKDFSVFLNPLVEASYEFGSVVKPITMAAGLEERVVEPSTTYEDKGEVKINSYTIKNFDLKAHGIQTMTQVLEKSLNTGVVFVARLLGKDRQKDYLKKFGLGEKTGIDLPGEVQGNLSNLSGGREIEFATASFGQGIALSPAQLIMGIGAIANEGKLMRPLVVDKIIDDSGNIVRKEPEVRREIISKETADALTKMLVSAVNSGFENRAGVKGYFVAGKTGTAQVPRKDGRGYSDKVIHTFVGYAPAFDPKFLVMLQLNEPTGNRFAANTLTPAFHDLAEYILNYYELPPDISLVPGKK